MLNSRKFNFVLSVWIIIAAIFLGMGIVNAMETKDQNAEDDVSVSDSQCTVNGNYTGNGCNSGGCGSGYRHQLSCKMDSICQTNCTNASNANGPYVGSEAIAENDRQFRLCLSRCGGKLVGSCVRDTSCDGNNSNTDQGGAPEMPGGPVTGGGNPPASCYPEEPGSVAIYTKDQKYTVDAAGKITLKWSHDSRWGKSCKEQNNTYRVFASVAASNGRCKKFNNTDYKLIYTRKADKTTITEKIGTKTYKGDLLGSDKFKFEAGKGYCVLVRKMNGQVGRPSSVVKITTEAAN